MVEPKKREFGGKRAYKKDDILGFIELFRDSEEAFREDLCYWFAFLLHGRFPASMLMYAPIAGHFFLQIDGDYYDVGGVYKPKEPVFSWRDYSRRDQLLSEYILRDKIDLPKTKEYDEGGIY